jgi:hypothetical protein
MLVAGVGLGFVLGRATAPELAAPRVTQIGAPVVAPSLEVEVRDAPWVLDSYRGVAAWVDVFDYAPAYRGEPAVDPDEQVAAMQAAGVETIFLQAARLDERSPEGITDRWWLASWLLAAHAHDLDIVAWYLPKHADPEADLARVRLIRDFRAVGHGVDGFAVDIEWTEGVPDHAARSAVLAEWSEDVRASLGDAVVGAIVLPPVQIEVINDQYWPGFPWRDLADDYDVWLPMSYASFRSEASGYRDARRYSTESIERLRNNLGLSDAPVHVIGGLAAEIRLGDLEGMVASMRETGALGVSVYDWDSLRPEDRPRLAALVAELG